MWGVVNEPDGTTSGLVKLQNIDFSGKTGTAQTESFELQNKLGKKLKENGWFVGYAPRRNPEIVVAALVQAGGWGSTSAAPIVRDVVKAYYDKKNAHLTQQASTAAPAPSETPSRPSASNPPAAAASARSATRTPSAVPVEAPAPPRPVLAAQSPSVQRP